VLPSCEEIAAPIAAIFTLAGRAPIRVIRSNEASIIRTNEADARHSRATQPTPIPFLGFHDLRRPGEGSDPYFINNFRQLSIVARNRIYKHPTQSDCLTQWAVSELARPKNISAESAPPSTAGQSAHRSTIRCATCRHDAAPVQLSQASCIAANGANVPMGRIMHRSKYDPYSITSLAPPSRVGACLFAPECDAMTATINGSRTSRNVLRAS
jgi:hypothetical protein